MTLSIIVAAAENNVIGFENKMPWHIPEDFKHFKSLTMGKPCIMGRKTYESILSQLGKPLPGRTSIVVSRSGYKDEGAETTSSLEGAIDKAKKSLTPENDEIMVIGGAQIYNLALPMTDKIYLTRVHDMPAGDAFFPALNEDEWSEIAREDFQTHSFITLIRKK